MNFYALSTPPGISGIAVIRISGKGALQIANQIIYSGSKFDIPVNVKNYIINLLQQRNFDASIMLQ